MSDNYIVFFPNPEFGAQISSFVGYFWENASFFGDSGRFRGRNRSVFGRSTKGVSNEKERLQRALHEKDVSEIRDGVQTL